MTTKDIPDEMLTAEDQALKRRSALIDELLGLSETDGGAAAQDGDATAAKADKVLEDGMSVGMSPGAWSVVGSTSSINSNVDEHASIPGSGTDELTADQGMIVVPEATLVVTEFKKIQICMAACDSGEGWATCRDQCTPNATFSCQNDTLSKFSTVQEYADFIAAFGKACPNATWTTHTSSWCGVTHTATFVCTYHCTHSQSVPGIGPSTPTNKTAHSDYSYIIKTDPDQDFKITHITKIWNDAWMLRDLGWTPDERDSVCNNRPSSSCNTIATELDSSSDHTLVGAAIQVATLLELPDSANDATTATTPKSKKKSFKHKLRKLFKKTGATN